MAELTNSPVKKEPEMAELTNSPVSPPAATQPPEKPKNHFVYRRKFDGVLGVKIGEKRIKIYFTNRTFVMNDDNIEAVGFGTTIKQMRKALEDRNNGYGVDHKLVLGTDMEIDEATKSWDKEIMTTLNIKPGQHGARPGK